MLPRRWERKRPTAAIDTATDHVDERSSLSELSPIAMTKAREFLPGFVLLPKVLSLELQQRLLDTACRVAAAPGPGQSGGWYRCQAASTQLNDGNKALAAGEASPILKQPALDFEPRVGAQGSSVTGAGREAVTGWCWEATCGGKQRVLGSNAWCATEIWRCWTL
eukprot:Skav207811  [mRNA]  locus=scaffold381:339040:345317:+ [translate_table: standard]